MAHIAYDARLAPAKAGLFANLKMRLEAFRKYQRTLNELRDLSDRELADLGIARGELRAIAHEAAYGA
ncbi:DUF1127 domain-containing protein [Paracoccaceae bacterium GXU_MW_L88]